MSFEELNVRLTALFDAHKQTSTLISRLAKLPSPPNGTHTSTSSSEAWVELGAEIHQSLKEQEEDFELLQQEVEDQANTSNSTSASRRWAGEKQRERTILATRVTRLGENLKIARGQFRRAQLQAKRNAEAAKRKERDILVSNAQEGGRAGQVRRKGPEKLSQDDILLNASNDVTIALRRTHALMQTEVTKSQFAQETLEKSTAALSTLSESYNTLDDLLSSSRTLVSSLLRSQKSDTWYLESAFWLLVTTICWLIFRRILYGPGWWLLYLPIHSVGRLLVFTVQVILSLSTTVVGSIGETKQSGDLSKAHESISSSLIVKSSASGDFPRFSPNMPAPSIAVGAGGSGAKGDHAPHKSQQAGQSLSDRIGEMTEASQTAKSRDSDVPEEESQGATLRARGNDEIPNPKKRVWEENISSTGRENTAKDEF